MNRNPWIHALALATLVSISTAGAAPLDTLPVFQKQRAETDWLIDASPYKAVVYRNEAGSELVLANGLMARTLRITPNGATVGLDNLVDGRALLRGVKPEAVVTLDGKRYEVGGLKGQPNYAYLLPEWLESMTADPGAMQLVDFEIGEPRERMGWKRVRHHASGAAWPPHGVYLRMDYGMPQPVSEGERAPDDPRPRDIRVSVHYELYDGIPAMSKWISVHNGTEATVRLNGFVSEMLAAVEYESFVDSRVGDYPRPFPYLHVETDYAMQSMDAEGANRFGVFWEKDPQYSSQVSYDRQTPCLLEVRPKDGPEVDILPGDTVESFRAFLMSPDGYGRERSGLAQRRLYRIIAPWVTENPLMMHVRKADWNSVKMGIDQCAEVGFEMIILTFGSGFNIEDNSPDHLARMKEYADYAREKGVEIGGYSLLASRRVGGGNDVVMRPGQRPTFGNSPCLHSEWGHTYFDKLYAFYAQTGFTLLEHDGSYPGDPCAATDHPGHRGYEDSRWQQRRYIGEFYQWCRTKGVYLNVPDYYYLSGSNKCGMGYREVNWSLPRAQQVLHTRQNIYDGTWEKTPSMGWMFVPLTQYHGGGAEASVEPLDKHVDHYRRMMQANLAHGVQAIYRGPRLYDTERVRDMVTAEVQWFKKYRAILESDLVHGRRADGRDLDWMLHVNPQLKEKGLLVVFNPLKEEVTRTLKVNLYYTGLTDSASVSAMGDAPVGYRLARDYTIDLPVTVPAEGMSWYVME